MEYMNGVTPAFKDETIRKTCAQLKSHNLDKIMDGIAELWKLYEGTNSNSDRSYLADKLAQFAFVETTNSIFTNLEIYNYPAEMSERIADLIFDLFIRLTNYSSDICRAVTESGFYLILVKEVKQNFLSTREAPPNLGRDLKTQRAVDCLVVLHNALRVDTNCCGVVMEASGLHELLIQITKSADGNLQIVALMTLCLSIDSQSNTSIVKVSKSLIDTLLSQFLSSTITDEVLNSLADPNSLGFGNSTSGCCTDEIFHCLSVLALNRENALEMIKQGVFSQLETYLDFAAEQIFIEADDNLHSVNNATKWALNLMLNLKKAVPQMSTLFTFEDTISVLQSHPNDNIKQLSCDLI